LLTMVGGLLAQAGNFTYLTFLTTDGTKVSLPVASLTITISGNTLTAGSQSFELTNLKTMYFSTANETTAIQQVTRDALDEAIAIYDLQGHQVEKAQMKPGVYIVKTRQKTYKMIVK